MAFVSNTSIFNQFFSDMVTPLEDDIYVPGTKIHCFYAVKMGEEYENRYRRHFVDPDIRYHAMQHEELLACYPEQWVEEVLASCRLDGRGMEENDFEERHFTEAERAQAEITESGNPRKPEGEDGKKMLERMNESHHNVTGWALSLWEIQGNDNILDIGCGGGNAVSMLEKLAPGGKVYGIDYSALSVEKAAAKNKKAVAQGRVKILNASVSSLPFQDKSIGLATAVETIYFWPDLKNDFKEVYRVLKDGGRFCVVCEMVKNSDGTGAHTQVADFLKLHYLSQEEIERLFIAAGFKNITIRRDETNGWLAATGIK